MTDYPDTIYKSAYYYGEHQMTLFINYRKQQENYSFLIKKGKYLFVFNLQPEETVSALTKMLKALPEEQLKQILKEVNK